MAQPTQSIRHMAIATPLGEDVLLLRSFSGREEISRLSEFELDLLSEDQEINFDDIIGQNVIIRMERQGGEMRFWNGFISRFVQVPSFDPQFARYRATVVPWLWFLTRTSDCRIFQEMTVPEIIQEVCGDFGFTDIEDRLSGGYPTWRYCVQYRETAFNFLSRLMEQEGIYYYFKHEESKHTLVLCDSLSKHDIYEDYDEISFNPEVIGSSLSEQITDWTLEKQVRPGKFAQTDYNFTKPKTSLLTKGEDVKEHGQNTYEIFDYPGEYAEPGDGDRYTGIRMGELARSYETCRGKAESRGISVGYKFSLTDYPRNDQNREYLVVSTHYHVTAEDYETSGGEDAMCACSFSTIPATIQFRADRSTPKPVVQGSQTAVVTGPSGEELYTDKYGRVKIQFPWDRYGQFDENSSCWIRVSQVHAGKGFGAIDIPRIGEEVIVDFLEGDPDQPIITGRVYNDDQVVPFGLPDKKVVSGMKSNSTKGGGGYNEFTMDDTKGTEKIVVHGQYDMETTIEHDQTDTVHNNRTTTVDVDDAETIGNDQSLSVGNNQTLSVGVDQTNSIGSNQESSIGADQKTTVGANQSLSVGAAQDETVGSDETKTVGANQTVSVGAGQTVSVGTSRSTSVGTSDSLSVGADRSLNVGTSLAVTAGAKIELTASASIKLVAGGSSIEIGPAGVKVTSPAMIEMKGAMIKHNC